MEQNLTIGELLKNARSKKNVSLEDVANKTKININILRALEKNDLERLPNKTYVKGFVKNCAKTLGVDHKQALAALELVYQELEPDEPEEEAPENAPEAGEEEAPPLEERLGDRLDLVELRSNLKGAFGQLINKKILIGAGVLAVLFVAVKGVTGFFSNIKEEKESLSAQKPAQSVVKPKESSLFELENSQKIGQDAQSEDEDMEDEAKESSEESAETAQIPAPKEEPPKEESQKESKEPEEEKSKEVAAARTDGKFPYVDFYPAPRNLFQTDANAEEIENSAILPERYKQAMDPDKHNIFINAWEGDTWLSYQVDGEDIKRYVLKQGRTLFLQAEEVVLLFLGNFNAAKIFYNNQLVKAQTRTGVKSLIFPESKSADYDLPLFPAHNGVPRKQDVYKRNMASKPKAE